MGTYTVNGKFPGKKLKGEEQYKKLYHYTSFNTFVKIWCTKKLKLGELTEVNDLLEMNGNIQTESPQQTPLIFAYKDIRTSYKQLSFTMDYDSYIKGCMSPLMWGVYGDKRKGVCIEFDYKKLNIPNNFLKDIVKYFPAVKNVVTLPIELKTKKDIKNFVERNAKENFFIKQESWKGENEFRLISDKNDYLDISSAISSVYLTSYDSVECLCVEDLIKDKCEIKFIDYIKNPSGNESIPITRDTRKTRESYEKAKRSSSNVINSISQQALNFYNSKKDDENASLILEKYSFKQN
ncbi:DUF2971 domain-containing protein [Wenyingzhuangia sp. 2_MG-2023]|uniref:DUF2971 domain-containing protein n=1 Tax=Wenyingzhuangia sp. 2_MG-2023 TaxID=3062639 RepID=UPI0026E46A67|nr:DUF2971 domain-containing protein [Wenyingzhuangia sp. 2_MG-2023]MDO6739392.1 DUF2971 domain-containing protein [Wenyingzhuangia sp. 2_MG-2023]